jgi:hypothetical protein
MQGVFKMETPKIRFINTSYETVFTIEDGEEIEIEAENKWIRYTCRYIDDFHFSMDGYIFHTYQFAVIREIYGNRYRPVIQEANEEVLYDNT